uniref:NADH-ubiquinone oxidoreductase chain 3 n=1 Tax=Globodera pallida TaxID=36090 RepID=Q9T6L9_GLOPA|nr:NADH-ubiquinone oxidoreductase subunit 3 [Globodera pallida]
MNLDVIYFFFVPSFFSVSFVLNFFLAYSGGPLTKLFVFESGFSSLSKVKIFFSLHFFLVLLIFVLFDLEFILILFFFFGGKIFSILFFLVVFFIFSSFFLEWYLKKLVWMF